jgi:hypothetical protein
LPSFGILILERLLEHPSMRNLVDFGGFSKVYRKRTFMKHVSSKLQVNRGIRKPQVPKNTIGTK